MTRLVRAHISTILSQVLKQKLMNYWSLICTFMRKSPEIMKQKLSVINIFICTADFILSVISVFSSICKSAWNFSISKPTIFFRFSWNMLWQGKLLLFMTHWNARHDLKWSLKWPQVKSNLEVWHVASGIKSMPSED